MGSRKTPIFLPDFPTVWGSGENFSYSQNIRIPSGLTSLYYEVSEAGFEFPQSLNVFADFTQQFYVSGDYTHQFNMFANFTQC